MNSPSILKLLRENIYEKNSNENIYRIMHLDVFIKMLMNKKLIFKQPRLWEDPFESFITKEEFLYDDEFLMNYSLSIVYAQCWTLNKECDGMWRSFASIDNGIKIETSVNKFYELMIERNNIRENSYVAKVLYVSKNEIDQFIENNQIHDWLQSEQFEPLAQIFTIKRNEFEYEKEIRVLILDFNNKEDILELSFEPIKFITKIEFAPKINDEIFEFYKEIFIKEFGFNEKIISKSDLYNEY